MEYFAKIQEPKKLRLSMMIAAKESIILISIIDEIEELRQKKLELMDSVKEDFKNMENFCNEMSNLIGDEKTRHDLIESFKLIQKEEAKEDYKNIKSIQKVKVSERIKENILPKIDLKTKTEVDRLDYTLKQIEEKIAALSR